MPTYKTTNVHLDILMGRDETVEPADFMTPGAFSISYCQNLSTDVFCGAASQMAQPLDIHAEMEKRLRM